MLRGLQGLLLATPILSQALAEIDFKISTEAPLTIENSRTISIILRLSAMLFSAKTFSSKPAKEDRSVQYHYSKRRSVSEKKCIKCDHLSDSNIIINDIVQLKEETSINKYTLSGVDYTMPTWNLMMKNIYQIPGGFQLQQEDFRLNILYTDPSPLNYITQSGIDPLPADVEQTPLLKVFNLDQLNYTNDPQEGGDGFFDFYPGLTIDTQRGKIIFTKVEPFGKHLFEKLDVPALVENYDDLLTYNSNQTKYVFRSLYKDTQAAALQESAKNK
jgi:hypothetical protein